MMLKTMASGARLMDRLGDPATAQLCREAGAKLRTHVPEPSGRKSPAALSALAGLRPLNEVAAELKKDGPRDLSTFYGFYVINALGEARETTAALDMIRRYWGGMLDLGATSFWEDFDLDWAEGTYPTPKGLIKVRHERQADGSIQSKIELPEGVERSGALGAP